MAVRTWQDFSVVENCHICLEHCVILVIFIFIIKNSWKNKCLWTYLQGSKRCEARETMLTVHLVLGQKMAKITEQLVKRRSLEEKGKSGWDLRGDMRKERGMPEWESGHLAWAWEDPQHLWGWDLYGWHSHVVNGWPWWLGLASLLT